MTAGTGFDHDEFTRRVATEVDRVLAEGRWSTARDRDLDARFERAAVAALRAPVLAERSVHLRRFAKAVVPARARPAARVVVRRVDALMRRAFAAGGSRRDG